MKLKLKFLVLLVPGLLFLGACGDYTPLTNETTTTTVEKPLPPGDRYNSYLVEADGVVYRCFDMGYHGGLWCTVQPRTGGAK